MNPGSRRGVRAREEARAAFARAGVACRVVTSERPGHAAELAASRGRDVDAVFTLGGDGTVMEVVSALSGTRVPVGVLPGGTGNLIARVMGIPLRVRHAVPALVRGDVATIDLGVVGGRRFAFAAGVGVDAAMVADTSARLKRYLGVAAYFLTAGRAALRHEMFEARVEVDGESFVMPATSVLVANFGAVFNDLIRIGPGIRADDGLLDLCVFSPNTLRDAFRIAWRMVRKDFRDDPRIFYRAGRRIRVETSPPRALQADGDLLGMTPFEVAVEPLAATLLVPRIPS